MVLRVRLGDLANQRPFWSWSLDGRSWPALARGSAEPTGSNRCIAAIDLLSLNPGLHTTKPWV